MPLFSTNKASILSWVLLFTVAFIAASETQAGEIRAANFLLNNQTLAIDIKPIAPILPARAVHWNLPYGDMSSYHSLAPGRYRILIHSKEKMLLDQTIGMGKKGTYSIIIAGINTEHSSKVNEKTWKYTLQKIVEGAATENSNGYLPQLLIKNDYFEQLKDSSRISVINLLPGSQPWKVNFIRLDRNPSENTLAISDLEYIKESQRKTLKKGHYKMQLSLSGSSKVLKALDFEAKSSNYYRIFLVPDPNDYLNHPKIIISSSKPIRQR